MNIIDGKKIAEQLKTQIKAQVSKLSRKPGIAVILIGNDVASTIYVNNKVKACQEVGFYLLKILKPPTISENTLLNLIADLNKNDAIDGILVQLPLPLRLSSYKITQAIDPNKDVDGFHANNIGRLLQNQPFLRPCTPKGVMRLLQELNVTVFAKHCVIVGSSNIVGRPMAAEMLNAGATITVCNSKTTDLSHHLKQADIVVVAVGRAKFIKKQMLKSGSIIIDIGINRLDNGKLVGDVDFTAVKDIAKLITPVPGGVGPMTIISLLENTLMAYQQRDRTK